MQVSSNNMEEGLIRSVYDETVQALDERVKFFQDCHISNETALLETDRTGSKSLCDILTTLGSFHFTESPVRPSLRDLYTSQYQNISPRCVLPPPSEGENSVNENQYQAFEPSFHWLSKTVIDSTHLNVDQIQPKKLGRFKHNPEWENITQLLIHNISPKIHLKSELEGVKKYLSNNFSKFPFVKMKKVRELYFKGKPALLLRFSDENSCSFAYYNFHITAATRKDNLGSKNEVYRVIENRMKLQSLEQKWVGVMVRKLPFELKKADFIDVLRKKDLTPIWVEELIEIQRFKYTLCKIGDLEEAFRLCSFFQVSSPFKEVKVNLHPKSAKIWKQNSQHLI